MNDFNYFLLLKNKVAAVFLTENNASSVQISEWRGKDISKFQESLLSKVKTQVSEKWFYTYFKNDTLEKIPRIDMLNILSMYAGFKDWANFKAEIKEISAKKENTIHFLDEEETNSTIENIVSDKKIILEEEPKTPISRTINEPIDETFRKNSVTDYLNKQNSKIALFILLNLCLGVGLLFMLEILPLKYTYTFNFIDSDRNKLINSNLEYTIIRENESPIHFKGDNSGLFKIKLKENTIKLIVSSPYYKNDTIVRKISSKYHTENVLLKTDDYALMLYYLSNYKVEDWKRRRKELNKLISKQAIIYQVYGKESYGVDVLTKEEFINKLTLPTYALKNLNIIETQKKNNKITKLKFEVTPYEN